MEKQKRRVRRVLAKLGGDKQKRREFKQARRWAQ